MIYNISIARHPGDYKPVSLYKKAKMADKLSERIYL
jgi:hypothetical protein